MMFKSILAHAYENTTLYHKLYHEHGIRPSDIRSLEDIQKLPILSKSVLNKYPIKERFSRKFSIQYCKEGRTSGSTGEPFRVYSEQSAADYLQALHFRRLLIYGYKPWYTIVIFGPFWAWKLSTLKRRMIRARFLNLFEFDANGLSVSDDPFENIRYLRRINPEVIWCPPSYLRLLTEAIRKSGVTNIKPKIIICGAEMLDNYTSTLVEETFGVKIFDEYGTVDVASRAIAWQCERHNGYHINMDSVYLEFVDENGEPISKGEEGYIVATNLFRYATPMIRYLIGDIGVPSKNLCSCGRTFPLIKSIQGRSDDFLVMPDGRLVSPFSVMVIMEDIKGIKKYQIVQEKTNKIIINYEPKDNTKRVFREIQLKSAMLFGKDVMVKIIPSKIEIKKGRKNRIVTSRVKKLLVSDKNMIDNKKTEDSQNVIL